MAPTSRSLSAATLAAPTACTIGFDNPTSLIFLPGYAASTFAVYPFYFEFCGAGKVRVLENPDHRYGPDFGSPYDHYHLMYELGPVCPAEDGSWGIKLGATICQPIAKPWDLKRYLASHAGDQWIRLYVDGGTMTSEMTFDLKGITVLPDQPIRLLFRKANGSWYQWSSLGPGGWNTSPYADGIREILISAAGGSSFTYRFDNIDLVVDPCDSPGFTCIGPAR